MNAPAEIDPALARQLQTTALVEMFTGLGAEASEHRVAYYLRLLERVPPILLRAACDRAVLASSNGYPPGPGEIIRAAEAIHDERVKALRKAWADEQVARMRNERGEVESA